MGNETSSIEEPTADTDGEVELRGVALNRSERTDGVAHSDRERARNPDTELHLDGEKDTLYSDGIDIEEDFETWVGADGSSGRIP
jgi:hypothetical protein